MKRTAPDRTARQPRPVEKVEVHEGKVKARIIYLILAILIAVIAFVYAMNTSTNVDIGWREIEADTAEMNCGQDFVFNYYLGGAGVSATAEYKALVLLYTQACEDAYRAFNVQEMFEGTGNLFSLNHNPNTPLQVEPMLYQAFELVNRLNSRYVFLAPVYTEYHSLFFCNDDWETAGYDPYQNEDIGAYFQQVADFARDPEAIRIELLGDNTLQLVVSEEYAAFAKENGISTYVDFYWMKDAFIVDYLAQVVQAHGYNRGAISSYNGFVRCLGEEQLKYSYDYYDLLRESVACKAARLNYAGGTSLVQLRSFPLNPQREMYYYQFKDGSVRTAYADMKDGKSKEVVPTMIATSRTAGCAEMLLRLLPCYAVDALDPARLEQLTQEEVYPLYSVNGQITTTSPDVTLDEVFEGYQVLTP